MNLFVISCKDINAINSDNNFEITQRANSSQKMFILQNIYRFTSEDAWES